MIDHFCIKTDLIFTKYILDINYIDELLENSKIDFMNRKEYRLITPQIIWLSEI